MAFTVFGKAYQVALNYAPGRDDAVTSYWDKNNLVDLPGLVNYVVAAGNVKTGCLPTMNGYYYFADNRIVGDWTIWRTWDKSGVALTDFSGKENTRKILDNQVVEGVPTANTISETLLMFRANSAVNEGHDDWVIPACGELAYMCVIREQLNVLFAGLGASMLNVWYWSSSEFNANQVYLISFGDGSVSYANKAGARRARFIRELF